MIGYFLDERRELFALLNAKLGEDFSLVPTTANALEEMQELADADVLIVGLPPLDSPEHADRFALLEQAVLNAAGVPVVAFLPCPDRQQMREAIATGAYDYFAETSAMEELRIVLRRAAQFRDLRREVQRLQREERPETGFGALVGADAQMIKLFNFGRKIAPTDATVLITGETGVGKELLARAIHQTSNRAREPFVAVACSSLPETLIEAELFGHEKGAFTGAAGVRRGRFEVAQRGTIFLDEIGELSAGLQVKLLRVLQERTFERLGSNQARHMEARVICATNRDLRALARSGVFRSDLYYRLNTIEIELPPLRERRDDILLLAHTLLRKYCEQANTPVRRISPATACALKRYSWPGNVRELQHTIERAMVISDSPEIRLDDLPSEIARGNRSDLSEPSSLDFEVRTFKRNLIQRRLRQAGNNKVQAARALQISRSSLHRLIDELKIEGPLESS